MGILSRARALAEPRQLYLVVLALDYFLVLLDLRRQLLVRLLRLVLGRRRLLDAKACLLWPGGVLPILVYSGRERG